MKAGRLAFLVGRNVAFITVVIAAPGFLLYTRYDFGLPGYFAFPLNLAGLVPATIGALLAILGALAFWRVGKATPYPELSPSILVIAGPYRYVRDPEFLGLFLMLSGFGILGNSTSLVIESFLATAVLHLFVVYLEEPGLERKFGDIYVAYKREVSRWIPKPTKRPKR